MRIILRDLRMIPRGLSRNNNTLRLAISIIRFVHLRIGQVKFKGGLQINRLYIGPIKPFKQAPSVRYGLVCENINDY